MKKGISEKGDKCNCRDCTARVSVRAKLWALRKRILRKHGHPRDKQEKATQTVLEQAQLLALASGPDACHGRN